MKALGITNRDFVKGLFGQLLRASERGPNQIDGDEFFFTIAVVKARKPADELDAMQVVQMAAVHTAAMRALEKLPAPRIYRTKKALPAH